MIVRLAGLFLAILGIVAASPAFAHPMPNSVVYLDFGSSQTGFEMILPSNELTFGFGEDIARPPGGDARVQDARLRAYLTAHFGARSLDARPWSIEIATIARVAAAGHVDLVVKGRLVPPDGASTRDFILHDDAINHEVMSHVILVFARSDYPAGKLSENAMLIGALQNPVTDLRIERHAGTSGSFAPAFMLGMRHIAGGSDHLLFLLALLLPAPLVARRGRWSERRSVDRAVRHLALIVSAFTLGHSVTLIIGSVGQVKVSQPPVEVLIAVSILVTAIQAWRPIFGDREPLIAFGFGLVHGLSFAAVIGGYVLSPWARGEAILGFNLGIEAVQLILVLIVAPLLVGAARFRSYGVLRLTGAAVAALAAFGWAGQRFLAMTADPTAESSWSGIGITTLFVLICVIVALKRRGRARQMRSTLPKTV